MRICVFLHWIILGSVIVADNVIFPGTPDYLAYIRSHPGFESEMFEEKLENLNTRSWKNESIFL